MTTSFIENELLVRRLHEQVKAGDPALPPTDLLKISGPFTSTDEFLELGLSSFGELLHMTDLHPGSHVLDYGCGLGRLAIPFSLYLDGGSYVGIDSNRTSIDHCAKTFADSPSLRFEHVDIHSVMYNPDGGEYDELSTVSFENAFDLTFLYSVFTHVLPEDLDGLLAYLYRALKPGGEMFASFFLLNEWSLGQIDRDRSKRTFPFEHGTARLDNEDIPEGAVAYHEDEVLHRLAAAGFDVPYVSHGRWSGPRKRNFHPHHQDLIVARKQ